MPGLLRRRRGASPATTFAYPIVLAVAVLCYAALGSVVALLPDYIPRLGGGAALVGLAVGAPAITGAAARPLGGRWADRHGPAVVVIGGAVIMAVGTLPGLLPRMPLLLASRLVVGVGEAAMMAAAVLWLLRLAGPTHRGRALGHIGLANYAGLAVGPPLARLVGAGQPARVLVLAASLPLLAAALAATLRSRRDVSARAARPARPASAPPVLLRVTARPGLGLLLVNVGYVAVLGFAATAGSAHQVHLGALVVPLFGMGVIASRTILGWVPDRVGATRTLSVAVLAEATGLVGVALSSALPVTVSALVLLALGQGLAVPALGMRALSAVPSADHGAASGLFFAYFDLGIGLAGPAVGLVAERTDPGAALIVAAGAVLAAAPAALLTTSRLGEFGDRPAASASPGHRAEPTPHPALSAQTDRSKVKCAATLAAADTGRSWPRGVSTSRASGPGSPSVPASRSRTSR